MQYGYRYHDSNGKIRTGEIAAPTREDAFQALKGKGVRPMQFWTIEAPAHRVSPWYWLAIGVLALLLVAAVFALLANRSQSQPVNEVADNLATPLIRRQGALTDAEAMRSLDDIFRYDSERTLALFAEPGALERSDEWPDVLDEDTWDALQCAICIDEGDPKEVVTLKRVVTGIKGEVAQRLLGGMSLEEVTDWLCERQAMEADFRDRIVQDEDDIKGKNARLRRMGLLELEKGAEKPSKRK